MRVRTKYILFVSFLHILTLALAYFVLRGNGVVFIALEGFVIVSGVVAWRLYLQLIRPLQTLVRGADAIRDHDFNVKFVLTGSYEMDQLIGVYNAMMDRLREERTRQEEQHFFLEKLIQTSPTGIVVLDFDEKVYQVNKKALAVLGVPVSAVVGISVSSFDHPLMRETAKLDSGESRVVAINGVETYKIQKSHFVDRGFIRSFIMMEEVTTEILAAEKRAYGKVIRMMAHEVNNTVGPVSSILSSTLESGLLPESLRNALQVAVQRNTNLNHFMRNFADVVRLPAPLPRPVDLVRLLEDVAALMRMRVEGGKRIVVEMAGEADVVRGEGERGRLADAGADVGDVAPEEGAASEDDAASEEDAAVRGDERGHTWMIMADAQQLEQAFINIVKNALEAIEGYGIVTIIVDAARRRVVVRDTGSGVDAELEELLFTPFFSTKPNGQGIGLTVIREILMNHGFGFSLKTVRAGVTEFEVRVG